MRKSGVSPPSRPSTSPKPAPPGTAGARRPLPAKQKTPSPPPGATKTKPLQGTSPVRTKAVRRGATPPLNRSVLSNSTSSAPVSEEPVSPTQAIPRMTSVTNAASPPMTPPSKPGFDSDGEPLSPLCNIPHMASVTEAASPSKTPPEQFVDDSASDHTEPKSPVCSIPRMTSVTAAASSPEKETTSPPMAIPHMTSVTNAVGTSEEPVISPMSPALGVPRMTSVTAAISNNKKESGFDSEDEDEEKEDESVAEASNQSVVGDTEFLGDSLKSPTSPALGIPHMVSITSACGKTFDDQNDVQEPPARKRLTSPPPPPPLPPASPAETRSKSLLDSVMSLDKNGDGKVDWKDLQALGGGFGPQAMGMLQRLADRDGDGKVDLGDLKLLAQEGGQAVTKAQLKGVPVTQLSYGCVMCVALPVILRLWPQDEYKVYSEEGLLPPECTKSRVFQNWEEETSRTMLKFGVFIFALLALGLAATGTVRIPSMSKTMERRLTLIWGIALLGVLPWAYWITNTITESVIVNTIRQSPQIECQKAKVLDSASAARLTTLISVAAMAFSQYLTGVISVLTFLYTNNYISFGKVKVE